MPDNETFLKLLKDYIIAEQNNQVENVIQAKCQLIVHEENFISLISNYITLNMFGIRLDYGSNIIKKGTLLYRIRYFKDNIDFSDTSQWDPNPNRTENRANVQGEEALYLSSDELLCKFETHLKPNEKYVIGTYECMEDIEVGSFTTPLSNNNLYVLIGIILNAFLTAPARSEKNTDLFKYLDDKYSLLNSYDFSIKDIFNMDLPFKLGALNKSDKYYEITNLICNTIKRNYPEGIRYSSCYIPAETVCIECSSFNLALYKEGIKKLKFKGYEIKLNDLNYNEIDIIKTILEGN